jgi:exosortase
MHFLPEPVDSSTVTSVRRPVPLLSAKSTHPADTTKAGTTPLSHTGDHSSIDARQHRVAFVFLAVLSVLIAWRPLIQTLVLAARNDEYTQILLVLPISVTLIFLDMQSLETKRDWGLRLGPPLVGLAILIALYVHFAPHGTAPDVYLAGRMLAFVVAQIGIYVLCCGVATSRSASFPLLLLFALVPLPQCVLNPIIALMQEGSAWSAHALFSIFGIPAIQKGVQLTIPGLTIQVAQECSSIRSSSMLLITAILLAQFFLHAFWRKAFIAAIAIPLSVAKNGLRIFVITVLGTRVDPAYLTGRLHHQGGVLFFAVALGCVIAAIWFCKRREDTFLAGPWDNAPLPEADTNR